MLNQTQHELSTMEDKLHSAKTTPRESNG
jgi:hypothetical protein